MVSAKVNLIIGSVLIVLLLCLIIAFVVFLRRRCTTYNNHDLVKGDDDDHAVPDVHTIEFRDVDNPLLEDDLKKRLESESPPKSVSEKRRSYSPRGGYSLDSGDDDINSPDDTEGEEIFEQVFLEGIVKAGYLYKKSTSMKKDWLKRWFFIKDAKLFYIHKPNDIIGKKDIRAVAVANLLITSVKETSNVGFQIVSPGQRKGADGGGVYEVQGDDPDEVTDWIRVIREQIEGSITNSSKTDPLQQAEAVNPNFTVLTEESLARLRAANPFCADCGATNPEWASLNLCIMICIECSGIHRSLGAHITKVRSITLDKWTPNATTLLIEVGNQRSNQIWEARSEECGASKPNHAAPRDERDTFITDKYAKKRFVARKLTKPEANSMLLRAAKAGNLVSLQAALAAGADVNAHGAPDQTLRCALHLVAAQNHLLCAELLCLAGAAVDEVDAGGKTALDLASARKHEQVVEVLEHYAKKS